MTRSITWGCFQQGQCGHSPWIWSPLQEHWSETMGQGKGQGRRAQDSKGEKRGIKGRAGKGGEEQ